MTLGIAAINTYTGRWSRALWVLALGMLLAFSTGPASARTFTKLGVGRGLDVSMGVALAVDADGLLWIGSREGLFRYDGYEAIAYLPDSEDPYSISDVDIRSLHVASDGSLWVGTSTGGLNRMDASSGRFTHFRHEPTNPGSLSEDAVYGIGEDADGFIWVTTRKGVNRVDPRDGSVERFRHEPSDQGSLSHDWGFAVHRGPDGALWIGTVGGGINRWNSAARGFDHFDLAALSGGVEARNDVFTLYESSGRLWAGTRDGLIELDLTSGKARRLNIGRASGHGPLIMSASADAEERLWLGTESEGVLVVDTKSSDWQPGSADPGGGPGNLAAQPPMSILAVHGTVFVGTWGDGIYRAPLEEQGFSLVGVGPDHGGLENKNVSAVLAGSTGGRPLVGTFGGGVQIVDVRAHRAEPPRSEPGDPLLTTGVLSLARTSDGTVYAGTTTGLLALGQGGESLWQEAHEPWNDLGIGPGYVTSLLPAGESGLWVGLAAGGLYFRDRASGHYESHRQEAGVADSLGSDEILALAADPDGSIWIGTGTSGLNRCRPSPWSCQRFDTSNAAGPPFPHRHITDLHRDRDGQLWVATDGGGLSRVQQDAAGQVLGFETWSSASGLLSDSIMGIAEDGDGSLWLSTRRGLSRLDPATKTIVNHVRQSGLPVSDFNAGAADSDEEFVYFGSVDGLVSVPRGSPMVTRARSPVVVTSVEQLEMVPMRVMHVNPGERLQVPYGEALSVRFAVLDYAETPHQYEYRMSGGDEWTSLGARRELTFIDLSPGDYRLEVRGRDVYGQWKTSAPLGIEVVPPLWMTPWFRSLLIAGALLLILLAHRARLGTVQRRAQELERLQDQRELALRRAEESQGQLSEAYEDLRSVTRRLESAKEEERLAVSRELHDELGQSLTAAKLSLQMLRARQGANPECQRLDDTVTMIDSMIGQVRDISRSLRPPLLDQAGLVPALEQLLDSLADRTGISIELDAPRDVSRESPAVRIALFRVVQEAVNNALRHAGAARIRVILREVDDGVGLEVEDDGVGFNPDSVSERARRGQHLGMVGMAERVRGVGGRFSVQAREGSGSRISAWVPLRDPEGADDE